MHVRGLYIAGGVLYVGQNPLSNREKDRKGVWPAFHCLGTGKI